MLYMFQAGQGALVRHAQWPNNNRFEDTRAAAACCWHEDALAYFRPARGPSPAAAYEDAAALPCCCTLLLLLLSGYPMHGTYLRAAGGSHNSCTCSTATDKCSCGQDAAVLAREAWGAAPAAIDD